MYTFKTLGDASKLRWRHKVRNMPKTKFPAVVDRAVWEKVTKRRTRIRCGSVVENAWKDIGGNQKDMLSIDKFGGYKTEVNKAYT